MYRRKKFPNPYPDSAEYGLNRAIRYLSIKTRSEKEVFDFLLKKDFNPHLIPQIIKKLKELKFLNDEEYGTSFMKSRQEYKGKSRYFIAYELKQKGLSEELIDQITNNSQEDLKTAKDFITRKKRVFMRLNKKEFKEKMIRLLSSRGFSFDIITRALRESQEINDQ